MLPRFPFGSDFDEVEQRLLPALAWLKADASHWRGRWQLLLAVCRPGDIAAREGEALLRMGLAHPTKPLDRLQRRLLQAALRRKT